MNYVWDNTVIVSSFDEVTLLQMTVLFSQMQNQLESVNEMFKKTGAEVFYQL